MDSKSRLSKLLKQLPTEKAPERDLWQGIELGLEQPERSVSKGRLLWLGSAAALILTAVLITPPWMSFTPESAQSPAQSPVQAPFEAQGNTEPLLGNALVSSLSKQHTAQLNALLTTMQSMPALTQNWQQQLTDLRQAETVITRALKQDPNNTALLQMLQNVHQQQLFLVKRVHTPQWQRI